MSKPRRPSHPKPDALRRHGSLNPHPEPGPGSALRHRRLLRCARSGPGQVRDGAARARRRPSRQSERRGVRCVAADPLSGPGRLGARRAGRAGAAEARAAAGAQAEPPRWWTFLRGGARGGSLRCGPRSWRGACGRGSAARSIRAASSGPWRAGKKNGRDRVHPDAAAREVVRGAYEDLRRRILAGAAPQPPASAWSCSCAKGSPPGSRPRRRCGRRGPRAGAASGGADSVSDELHAAVVRVLASMALSGLEEMRA